MIKAMEDGISNKLGRFTKASMGDEKFEELSKASAPFPQKPCLISQFACDPLGWPGSCVFLLSQTHGLRDMREGLEALGLAPRCPASELVP